MHIDALQLVLIGPCGIETLYRILETAEREVLIGPCGIETVLLREDA